MSINLNELRDEVHMNAKEKGFWDGPYHNTSEKLMLIVSELGEAQESMRIGKQPDVEGYKDLLKQLADSKYQAQQRKELRISSFKEKVKDSFEDELADAFIRILDLAGHLNIDIDFHVREKMFYNSTRERLHGKKF